MKRKFASLVCLALSSLASLAQVNTSDYSVQVSRAGAVYRELFSVGSERRLPALSADTPVRVVSGANTVLCTIDGAVQVKTTTVVSGTCTKIGRFEQRFSPGKESDVLEVATRLDLLPGASVRSMEDRYSFVPEKHKQVDETQGPLDFVWSQNIKREKDDLVPAHAFKSPAVMMQQGAVFAAILAEPSSRHVAPLALDLDVTSEAQPWLAYGAIPSTPHDHSYFRRSADATLNPIANTIEYRYALVLSAQPARQGYRRVSHLLWQRLGHSALLEASSAQRNALRPELSSFNSWREDAWHTYADRVYRQFACGERTCGTLASDRNYLGEWSHPEPDAWFNAWFQTLRTAYGWYVYGRAHNDQNIMQKAESILNLALSSPRKQGAFSTIYLLASERWVPGDGWASYADSYHSFSMSWTAYWMLRWAEDLTPARKEEVLAFVKPYGMFLVQHQQPSGVIPSWYRADTMQPREEFRDFNAETAPSALLLAELGKVSGDHQYVLAAERAMGFVETRVVPRQRWFDFETFLSCARKEFSFFDTWTAQFPQNNLAELQAPQAMLALYAATHEARYLEDGTRMLDYLLLTQQVWSNPEFTPTLVGGFTTQNTDAEWSDARQGYAATLLMDYYNATGKQEYLERAVAAARSSLAVAPWENWAHTGFIDEPGALTGFHWGTGSAMTSVELMSPELGDALVDVAAGFGVGFDESSVTNVMQDGDRISFDLHSLDLQRSFLIRFRGIDAKHRYLVRCNGQAAVEVLGKQLIADGLSVRAQP